MINKRDIERPIDEALAQFRDEYAEALHSDVRTIRAAIEAVYHSGGKHIRPLLLLLTAEACGGVQADSVHAAVFLELLHIASLIHDDVVDDTRQRRGQPSMNAVFDNRIAVLVGDFVLSEALIRATRTGSALIVSLIASLSRQMAEGEIKQLENAREQLLTEEDYFMAVEKKTAMLLAVCAEIGAVTAGADADVQAHCREFGRLLGCSFQLRDDLFDYFDLPTTGKPGGNDIREGKVTLPLLYALASTDEATKAPFLSMIRRQDFTPENVAALIRFAKEHGGIAYAERRMAEYRDRAKEAIRRLPDSPARESLLALADYIVGRNV
ncbi:polyprenyl synthetase [Tannerella sp. oral taxon 808]|nr:polyprenyl synthetase [Tannerella sp. oral taxon 808]